MPSVLSDQWLNNVIVPSWVYVCGACVVISIPTRAPIQYPSLPAEPLPEMEVLIPIPRGPVLLQCQGPERVHKTWVTRVDSQTDLPVTSGGSPGFCPAEVLGCFQAQHNLPGTPIPHF